MLDGKPSQRLRDGRELLGPVVRVPAEELGTMVLDSREDAIAVVFELVQPAVTLRGALHERRELGLDELGERGPARAGHLDRVQARAVAAVTIGVPDAVSGRSDLLDRSAGRDALRLAGDDRLGLARARLLVALLDEQPAPVVSVLSPSADLHERPASMQLLALQGEFQ